MVGIVKRLAVILLGTLIAGAMLQTGIAWFLVLQSSPAPINAFSDPALGDGWWEANIPDRCEERYLAFFNEWDPNHEYAYLSHAYSDTGVYLIRQAEGIGLFRAPYFFVLGTRLESGWPFRSMRGSYWYLTITVNSLHGARPGIPHSTEEIRILKDAIEVRPTDLNVSPYRLGFLPMRPVLAGFIGNSILFALPIAVLLGYSPLRRIIRARRNRCVRCGYPIGSGTRCSECGNEFPRSRERGRVDEAPWQVQST